MDTPSPMQALVDMLIEAQWARAVCLVCLTCVVWHHLSTVADEMRLVWRYGPLRVNSGLFLFIRYLTLVSFATPSVFSFPICECQASALFTGTASLIIIALCDLVLLIRLWAIYQRRRPILIFLLATFMVTTTLMFIFGVQWLSDLSVSIVSSAPFPDAGCFFTSPVLSHHWEIYPFTIAFNSILLAMTVYKSVCISWNHNALVNTHWYGYTRTTMSSLLLRDGVLSYLVVLLALLFTAVGAFIPACKLIALQSGIAPAVLSITTSQLQLNLRSALDRPRAKFCSCPLSYVHPSPSRSTLFPLSIPSFGLGFTHHATCALSSRSSTIDHHLFSSTSTSFAASYDNSGECVFNTHINDRDDFNDYHDENDNDNEEKQTGRPDVFPFDCESLKLPSTPLPAHMSRTMSV